MNNKTPTITRSNLDPTVNVREMISEATGRLDDLRKAEVARFDERIDGVEKSFGVVSLKDYFDLKIALIDAKIQSQFTSAKEAVGIASTAQEKAMTVDREGTKDALDKADVNNDKRFDGISQKIDAVSELLNKNAGSQGVYVTHSDLATVVEKIQTSFDTSLQSIKTSLQPLIAFMNNQTGKEGVTDPMMQKLFEKMDAVITVQEKGKGRGEGLNAGWIYLIGAISLLGAIITIFHSLS